MTKTFCFQLVAPSHIRPEICFSYRSLFIYFFYFLITSLSLSSSPLNLVRRFICIEILLTKTFVIWLAFGVKKVVILLFQRCYISIIRRYDGQVNNIEILIDWFKGCYNIILVESFIILSLNQKIRLASYISICDGEMVNKPFFSNFGEFNRQKANKTSYHYQYANYVINYLIVIIVSFAHVCWSMLLHSYLDIPAELMSSNILRTAALSDKENRCCCCCCCCCTCWHTIELFTCQ